MDSHEARLRLAAFLEALKEFGWSDGRSIQIEVRWSAGDPDLTRKYANELAALGPDIIVTSGTSTIVPVMQAARTIPIVFVQVSDPVRIGVVLSLARPGGNATGFTQFEFGTSAKWLELLKEIAPPVTRAGVLKDPNDPAGIGQWAALQSAAPLMGVTVTPIDVRHADDLERDVGIFAHEPNGGLIVTASGPTALHRELIARLAARANLPAVYAYGYFARSGGLAAYGPDTIEPYRRAANYVDRILRGEKAADLPVQAPTKYELVINLKTAKALGLTVPASSSPAPTR